MEGAGKQPRGEWRVLCLQSFQLTGRVDGAVLVGPEGAGHVEVDAVLGSLHCGARRFALGPTLDCLGPVAGLSEDGEEFHNDCADDDLGEGFLECDGARSWLMKTTSRLRLWWGRGCHRSTSGTT